MRLLILLIIVPIIEVYLFIEAGQLIGTWPIIAIMILTAIVGAHLLRGQGLATMQNVTRDLSQGSNPANQLAHGALILVSGVVLMTPGFFTDAIGLLLLVPMVRDTLIKWGQTRMINNPNIHIVTPETPASNDTVDGQYTTLDDPLDGSETPGHSGWTKH